MEGHAIFRAFLCLGNLLFQTEVESLVVGEVRAMTMAVEGCHRSDRKTGLHVSPLACYSGKRIASMVVVVVHSCLF